MGWLKAVSKATGAEAAIDVAKSVKKDPNPFRAAGNTMAILARGSGNVLTGGLQDKISIKGKSLGAHIEDGVGGAFDTLRKGVSSLDPTKVGQVSTAGVDSSVAASNAQIAKNTGGAQAAGGRAAPTIDANGRAIARTGVRDVTAGTVQAGPAGQNISGTVGTVADKLAPRAQGVTAGTTQSAEADASRGFQSEAMDLQRQAALGNAPSAAQLQLQAGLEDSIDAQFAAAASARGGYNPGAMRQAARQGAALSAQANQQSAMLRADEMAKARDSFAGTAGQVRQGDITQSSTDAELALRADLGNMDAETTARAQELQALGMDQGTALATAKADQEMRTAERSQDLQANIANIDTQLKAQLANQGVDLDVLKTNAANGNARDIANLEAKLKQAGLNDAMVQAYMNDTTSNRKIIADGEQAKMQADIEREKIKAGIKSEAIKGVTGVVGQIGGGVAGAAGAFFSDPKLKKDVRKGDDDVAEFLAALKPRSFKYKNSRHGKGNRLGIMTSDAKRSRMGREMVVQKDEGEAIDIDFALSAALAGLAYLNKKVSAKARKGA